MLGSNEISLGFTTLAEVTMEVIRVTLTEWGRIRTGKWAQPHPHGSKNSGGRRTRFSKALVMPNYIVSEALRQFEFSAGDLLCLQGLVMQTYSC